MELTIITKNELLQDLASTYGYNNNDISIESTVVVANLIRRIASFSCPCQRNEIISILSNCFNGLLDESVNIREKAKKILEDLIEYSDLIELSNIDDENKIGNILYLTAPTYVPISENQALIYGIAPNQIDTLPDDLEKRVRYNGVYRIIKKKVDENLTEILSDFGLRKISFSKWIKSPAIEDAKECIEKYKERLSNSELVIENRDIEILDPSGPISFYPKRWKVLRKQSGTFNARRPIQYQSDKYCLLEVENGELKKAVDFPIFTTHRPYDEAWYLQCAIDSLNNNSQLFSIEIQDDSGLLKLFSPIPRWIKRQLDIRLQNITPTGCLIAYKGEKSDVDICEQILINDLWLKQK